MTHVEAVLEDIPQLLTLVVARVLDLEVAPLGDNLLGGKGPFGLSPARAAPPRLDLLDFFEEELVFDVGVDARVDHIFRRHGDVCVFVETNSSSQWMRRCLKM